MSGRQQRPVTLRISTARVPECRIFATNALTFFRGCDRYSSLRRIAVINYSVSREQGGGVGETTRRLIAQVRYKGGCEIVEEAYLQYASPFLGETLRKCLQQRAEQIMIVPLFMHPGAYATKDIPGIIDEVKKQHPGIEINITKVVGALVLMPDIVLDLMKKGDCGVRMN